MTTTPTRPTAAPAAHRPVRSPAPRKRQREPVAATARVLLYLLYGLPLLWIVLTSLKEQGAVLTGTSLLSPPTLDAYRELLSNPELPPALFQSFQIAVGTMVLVLALAVPLAFALAKANGRIVSAVLGLLIFLQMVPQTASVIPLFALFNQVHLLDTTIGLVLADTALLLPWGTLLLRPFFAAIPDAIEEAAAIDGAGRIRVFVSIVVPMARNGIATVGSLIFLVAWGEFLYAINLLISPINYPMSALIAQQTSGYGVNWPGLMALAVISAVPLLTVYGFSFRLLREGLALGSVK